VTTSTSLQIEFMREMQTGARLAVASVAGTIMVARSPAAAIAVLREVRTRTQQYKARNA
jgi:hypothetical protein